jgi:imidazolonepropionase-like amidohydrolase
LPSRHTAQIGAEHTYQGERIKAVSGGFIDPPPGGELIDLRKKFVLPGLIGCHVHLTAQLDQ